MGELNRSPVEPVKPQRYTAERTPVLSTIGERMERLRQAHREPLSRTQALCDEMIHRSEAFGRVSSQDRHLADAQLARLREEYRDFSTEELHTVTEGLLASASERLARAQGHAHQYAQAREDNARLQTEMARGFQGFLLCLNAMCETLVYADSLWQKSNGAFQLAERNRERMEEELRAQMRVQWERANLGLSESAVMAVRFPELKAKLEASRARMAAERAAESEPKKAA